ncbi:uncharacterized protein [Amphiura filiformis]|uniref:uncharacterized protein n=1 Tax=Amphiura filiformis TaxID=82378 RepID=UPI003B21895F
MFGAHKKSRCLIIAYMVLSIVSSVIAVQQVFTSLTFVAFGHGPNSSTCPPMSAVASAVGLMEIIASIVAAACCCRIVCCGQPSTTMVQYVPAVPMGVPQPGMLQGHSSVYSPVTCPAGPGEATFLSMPVHPPPYQAAQGATAPPAAAGELPSKEAPDQTGPYHSTTGVDGDNPENAQESLLS